MDRLGTWLLNISGNDYCKLANFHVISFHMRNFHIKFFYPIVNNIL